MSHLVRVSPAVIGWNARTLPAAVGTNTNPIPCVNCTSVRFFLFWDYVAAGDITFTIQGADKIQDFTAAPAATDWFTMQSEAIILGVGTLSNYSNYKVTVAADQRYTTLIGTAGLGYIRLANVYDSTAAATTDTLTIFAELVQEQ